MSDKGEAIDQEAVEWVVRLGSDQRTRADEDAFRNWLERDPANAHAYADCMALWDGVSDLAATHEAHEILKPLRAPGDIRRRFNRRTAIFGGLGAALAVAAGVVVPIVLIGEETFKTAPGKQKRVQLADGSEVFLNTDSKLRVKFVAAERRLFLDRGQAFFQVAKDKNRPFRVFVGNDEVRAIGTAFEVRRIGDSVQVTLEEGRVAIYRDRDVSSQAREAAPPPKLASGQSVLASAYKPVAELSPGEQVMLAAGEAVEVRHVDLRKSQAWRYGRMILDDAPLGETVAELNRYGGVQIVLADPKLANIRVSGVFHTGRPDDFVEAVTAAFPVEIERQGESAIVLKPR
jgi:transmembrane sensor